MIDKKRVIVSGGAGFIGSAMVRYLIKNTENEVMNIDCLTYSGNLSSLSEIKNSSRYQFVEMNIGNLADVSKILLDFKPEIIINFAAESHVDKSIESPSIFFETNVLSTLNFLEAIKIFYKDIVCKKGNFFRFHHISTDEVYGDINLEDSPVNEKRAYNPSSPYAASKASSDHIMRSFHRTYGIPLTISNCSNNYGPYHFPEKLIPHIIISSLQGETLPVYGDGLQIRDWLHVDDHILAILKIIEKGKIGETYNIGGDNEQNNLFVVNKICEILDSKVNIKPKGIKSFKNLISFVDDRPGHDKRYAIDSEKLKKELGWRPSVNFEQGLGDTIDWYINNSTWWDNIISGSYNLKRQGKLET